MHRITDEEKTYRRVSFPFGDEHRLSWLQWTRKQGTKQMSRIQVQILTIIRMAFRLRRLHTSINSNHIVGTENSDVKL